MVKFYRSLQWQLTVSFLVMILVITSLTYFYTYNEAKEALKDNVKDQLLESVKMVTSQVTPEMALRMLSYEEADADSEGYIEDSEFLLSFMEVSRDIDDIYVVEKKGDSLYYAVDACYIEDREDCAPVDMEFPEDDYTDATFAAFAEPTVEPDIYYYEEWGYLLSAYAPVKDEAGNTIAVIGMDMNVGVYQEKVDFLSSLIYYIMGASILAAVLIILFFSATIIKDINKMTKVANKISAGELDFKLPEIKSKNEIYELNEGLKSVVAAVEFLKEEAESKNRSAAIPAPVPPKKPKKKPKPKKAKKAGRKR